MATVGVYHSSLDDFLDKLKRHRVAMVVDVRQRRGVRGREYAWANSRRLQATLGNAEIPYRHLPELAPTTELRHLQYREDDRLKVGRRSRVELSEVYRRRNPHGGAAVIEPGKDLELPPFQGTFEPSECLRKSVCTWSCYDAIGPLHTDIIIGAQQSEIP